MGKFQETIQDATREFIAKQHLFFVATAPLFSRPSNNTIILHQLGFPLNYGYKNLQEMM